MEMQQVRYFLALSETLNFTRAAELCNVSQPALTTAIKNLEEELGGILINRERSNTHLTELGRMMQPYLQSVFDQAQQAKQQAKEFAQLGNASIEIGVMCTIGPEMLYPFFGRFHESHPDVKLGVTDLPAGDLQAALEKGELEVAIFGLPTGLDPQFHALPLFEEDFLVAVSERHPFCALDTVHCQDLHGQDYVARVNCEFDEYAGGRLADLGVQVNPVFSSERDDWVQGMILADMGFGFFPEFAVTAPGMVTRPLRDPSFRREINLATVRGRRYSPGVGALVREANRHHWQAAPRLLESA